MAKENKLTSIIIPGITVFISSGCIMVIELVAGRLIARHLGSSLYTWTSVIGIVLAGITLGNWLGGRIADKYDTRKALSWLFVISAVSCLLTVFISNVMGSWPFLWQFGFLFGVIVYIFSTFFLPSCLLGAVSPVVAKMALDQGLATGRTVGDIYACGAAGSILGTFVTGYYLIAAMGTIRIIWVVSGILFCMGIVYSTWKWAVRMGAIILVLLAGTGALLFNIQGNTEERSEAALEKDRITLVSEDTQYSYVSVDTRRGSDVRTLRLNNYVHGVAHTQNPSYLRLDYSRFFAAITQYFAKDKDELSTLCIGGGAFVLPRYIDWKWPNSPIDIVEIDPALTRIAESELGFEKKTNMRIFHMDARNYINSYEKDPAAGQKQTQYNFVYGDAFGDNAIPFQLVTREFNDSLSRMMSKNGVYMINVIDIYPYGRFLGAFINTLEQTFPHVQVLSRQDRETNFVVVASSREMDLDGIENEALLKQMKVWVLSREEIQVLKQKTRGLIFTDNFAPTDNLISPVAAVQAKKSLANQAISKARALKHHNRFEEVISKYESAVRIHPPLAFEIYREIGHIYSDQEKWEEVVMANQKALASEHPYASGISVVELCLNIWDGQNKLGKADESAVYLQKAMQEYRLLPETVKGFHETTLQLCYALLEEKQYDVIIPLISRSIKLMPQNYKAVELLAFIRIKKGDRQEAIRVLQKGLDVMAENGDEKNYTKLQSILKRLIDNREI